MQSAFFFPPFGLLPGIKYIMQVDQKAKKIGYIAVTLTILSVILSFVVANKILNDFNLILQSQTEVFETPDF